MLLEKKNVVVYGAGGAVGSAVARAFAREGARVFLTGRRLGPIEDVAKSIVAAGGVAEVGQVDAVDEQAVEAHASAMEKRAGSIAKAMGIPREQFLALMESMSHTRRSTTLAELASAAVLVASDLARGMTGTVANLTAGKTVD